MQIIQAQVSVYTQKVNHSTQRHSYYSLLASFVIFSFIFFVAMQDLAFAEKSLTTQYQSMPSFFNLD